MQPVVIFLFLPNPYSPLLDLRVNPVSWIFYFYLQATVAIASLGSFLAALLSMVLSNKNETHCPPTLETTYNRLIKNREHGEEGEEKRGKEEENQFRFNFASINAIQSHGRPSSSPQVKKVTTKKTETSEAQKSKEIIIELTASEAPEDGIA